MRSVMQLFIIIDLAPFFPLMSYAMVSMLVQKKRKQASIEILHLGRDHIEVKAMNKGGCLHLQLY